MSDELKAIEEVAKATGKGFDLAKSFGGFIASLTHGSLEQAMGIFEDKLKYMRWERQIRLMERANKAMEDRGLKERRRPLSLKLGVPLLQGASLEDDNYLQDLWVNLLVNALDNERIEPKRIYIDILERLSPLEAKIIKTVYSYPFSESFVDDVQYKFILTHQLPTSIRILGKDETGYDIPLNNPELELALVNLVQIGCIASVRTIGGGDLISIVRQTFLGKYFYEACSLK